MKHKRHQTLVCLLPSDSTINTMVLSALGFGHTYSTHLLGHGVFQPPPPKSARKSQQIGGPIFRQNSFPRTWIAVPGPKHTFPLVVVQLESCGNSKCLSIFGK